MTAAGGGGVPRRAVRVQRATLPSTKTRTSFTFLRAQKQAESRCHSARFLGWVGGGGAPGPRPTSSGGPFGAGSLRGASPLSVLMWTFFTYVRGRGCFLSLGSVAIREQQAVELRAPFPDTRLAALALVLAIPQFYWSTGFFAVIGWKGPVSAIRRYERSATREMTATV